MRTSNRTSINTRINATASDAKVAFSPMVALVVALAFLIPAISFAAPSNFAQLLGLIRDSIIKPFIPVVIALGLLAFIWGVTKYMTANGDPQKRSEGTKFIIWGLVGLFVMISVWGLVAILSVTFQLDTGSLPFPTLR
ncbi:MAG: hypothetical protein COW88_02815 [Candidatus Lloydbacteria bacterium CG22_combo_CG10-13_8_21_14_all_47_15]|uniref:Uncharacterized protein n=1 Tax=Candidatus Lloydbacteria bacterium CG22_combo_CG10-13_8_21_14_all_47_15 TaxID=1974635 RepID=A0A2H0CUR7_9BACT|nr:MAG: hypothetical protein COW88_02815 [Candidatus Lloydbacteria bacterium CG22_combo_CG10-13_8_21_14_all_47_15]